MSLRSILLTALLFPLAAEAADPVRILHLPGSGTDPEAIRYAELPVIEGTHAVINSAKPGPGATAGPEKDIHHLRLNLHNYLIHHGGKFHAIWSDGPRIEDFPTQEILHATSEDGLHWDKAQSLTGRPSEPYAFIARGLWERDGELLALAAHYQGKGAFGSDKELKLQAYQYDGKTGEWKFRATLFDDAINNFAPQKLPSTGDWILTRRDSRFNVSVLIGGRKSLTDWKAYPVVGVGEVKGFRPDEPIFWPLEGGTLFALYRDNGGSQRLFHSVSKDSGQTWGVPEMTNFPNATSKLFAFPTSRGERVLILNANPKAGRRELHLALSRDGKTFTALARLGIPSSPPLPDELAHRTKKFSEGIASLQYPHVIEHEGSLWIALSRLKVQTEIFRVPLTELDKL